MQTAEGASLLCGAGDQATAHPSPSKTCSLFRRRHRMSRGGSANPTKIPAGRCYPSVYRLSTRINSSSLTATETYPNWATTVVSIGGGGMASSYAMYEPRWIYCKLSVLRQTDTLVPICHLEAAGRARTLPLTDTLQVLPPSAALLAPRGDARSRPRASPLPRPAPQPFPQQNTAGGGGRTYYMSLVKYVLQQ